MYTKKINVYDGVPIGPNNFSKFFDNLEKTNQSTIEYSFRSTDGSSFGGGHAEGHPAVMKKFGTAGQEFYFISGTVDVNNQKVSAVIFGEADGVYYRSENPVLTSILDVPVNTWEILATSSQSSDNRSLKYTNDYTIYRGEMQLPFRPVKTFFDKGNQQWGAGYGAYSIRYNGVPQPNAQLNFSNRNYVENLELTTLSLGSEYPVPINSRGSYIHALDLGSDGITLKQLQGLGDGRDVDLTFPHTNFNMDYGGHILLKHTLNGATKYLYVPQDASSEGSSIPDGTYRVKDRAKGIITLRLTEDDIRKLRLDDTLNPSTGVRFHVISAEQLLEQVDEYTVVYKSRYGNIYDGVSANTELVSVSFSEGVYFVSNTFNANVSFTSDSSRDVIYESSAGIFDDSIILALKYGCVPTVNADNQRDKHEPDIITMYYSQGIHAGSVDILPPVEGGTVLSNIRGFVDINKASWYNWDVNNYEYAPVHRIETYDFSLALLNEVIHSRLSTGFQPTSALMRHKWGVPEFTYVHKDKVSIGTKEVLVRSDAKIPEPHHINPPMIKYVLTETLTIPAGEQMMVFNELYVDGDIYVDGVIGVV